MECIFCRQDSSASRSVEHIVPESFGNKSAVLPKGIVCDKCNNYFSRKVEQPFLESEIVRVLRQELEITNKNGKLITDYQYPRVGREYVKKISKDIYLIYTNDVKTEQEITNDVAEYQRYLASTDFVLLKKDIHVSRLLAKMAVEFFVHKCGSSQEICEYVSTDEIFDSIRNYARYGSRKMWDYNVRRVYARDEAYEGDPFSAINWEADFMFLGNGEVYFIIAMYGIEYAINMGGSTVEGYTYWLKENNYRSPLYMTEEKKDKHFNAYINKISSATKKVLWNEFDVNKR